MHISTRAQSKLAHSLVHCCEIRYNDGHRDIQEQVPLPPRHLLKTDATSIGAGLIQNLESHLLGMDLVAWAADLGKMFRCLLVLFVADCAAANLKLMRVWRIICRRLLHGIRALFWFEPCALHRAGRCSFHTFKLLDLVVPLYSLGKIAMMHRHRVDAMASVRRLLKRDLVFRQGEQPPECLGTSTQLRERIKRTVLAQVAQMTADDAGQAEAGLHGEAMPQSEIMDHLDAALKFFNGDITQPTPQHYCFGGCGCRSRAKAVKKAATLIYNVTWASGTPDFNPSRWAKQVPALQWWCRLAVLHRLPSQIYLPENFCQKEHPRPAQDVEAAIRSLIVDRIPYTIYRILYTAHHIHRSSLQL